MSAAPALRRGRALLLAAAATVGGSSGAGAQVPSLINPVCEESCPNPVTDPAGAAACLARQQACTTKIGLYQTYMAQLGLMTTRHSLPQLYVDLLQPLYRGVDLRGWRFAFGDRQPADNATTDCSVTYFNHRDMVDDVRMARLDEPWEFSWLLHELRHFAQCGQLGGRDAYAKMWFGHLELAFIQTNSADMATLHDAMFMESDAARVAASNQTKIEPMRDRHGRLVRPLAVQFDVNGSTAGASVPAMTGTPVRIAARTSGGSTPIDFVWTLRRPGSTSFSSGASLLRSADVLELTPDRSGTYEVRVRAGQNGAPLAPANASILVEVSDPPIIARTGTPVTTRTAVRTTAGSATLRPLGTLTVQVFQRAARSRRGTASSGASVTVGTADDPKKHGRRATDDSGLAAFPGLPLSSAERLTITVSKTRCGSRSVEYALTQTAGTVRVDLVC